MENTSNELFGTFDSRSFKVEGEQAKIAEQLSELIRELSRMNRLLAKKNHEIEKLYSELQGNLEFARFIQKAMMPPAVLLKNDLWITSFTEAPQLVSGDLYDVVPFRGGTVLYVADVSGHGVPAALLCSAFKALFRFSLTFSKSLVSAVNVLAKSMRTVLGSSYVTALFAHVKGGAVRFLNCGHPPPLLFFGKFPQKVELPAQPPIGLESHPYSEGDTVTVNFQTGQPYLLFSDGVYSCFEHRVRRNEAALDRFLELVEEIRKVNCRFFVPEVLPLYLPYKLKTLGYSFTDDVTLVAFGKLRKNSSYGFYDSGKVFVPGREPSLLKFLRRLQRSSSSKIESGRVLLIKKGNHTFALTQDVAFNPLAEDSNFGKLILQFSTDGSSLLVFEEISDSDRTVLG